MALNISVWRLATHILKSTLILDTIVSQNKYVLAEISVTRLWNATVNKTDADSCGLTLDNNLQDLVKFTGDTVKTCSVQLVTSNGTAALIWIPQGALVYEEGRENILNCRMKYVSLTADEPCLFVSRHPKLQLFLLGHINADRGSINISQMPGNASAPIWSVPTSKSDKLLPSS